LIKSIRLKASSRSYDIKVINNTLSDVLREAAIPGERGIFVVAAGSVMRYHEDYVRNAFSVFPQGYKLHVLKASERQKNLKTVESLTGYFSANGLDRKSIVFVIGGGVLGDTTAFAASVYQRGTDFIHIPTTIMAMTDSAIGGKSGVNFGKLKNYIGTIRQPLMVINDLRFLKTLPKEEVANGMGEVLKYALIKENRLEKYFSGNPEILRNDKELADIITRSVKVKKHFIEADEFEYGERKALNFGHTFGHAIEGSMNFKVKHGLAVVAGILCASSLSARLGLITPERLSRIIRMTDLFHIRKIIRDIDPDPVIKLMKGDKKNSNGKIKGVMIAGESDIKFDVVMTEEEIREIISHVKSFYL